MNTNEIKEKLKIEDFPESFQDVVECIGMEAVVKLMEYYGGSTIYIPKFDVVTKRIRNDLIKADYLKGMTYRQIALKYNLGEDRIRRIVVIKSYSIEDYL